MIHFQGIFKHSGYFPIKIFKTSAQNIIGYKNPKLHIKNRKRRKVEEL